MLTIVQAHTGQPTLLGERRGRPVYSSLVKTRVEAPFIAVGSLGFEGDRQADERVIRGNRVHGGVKKAVYAYPLEHLAAWEDELPGGATPGASFGENLTVIGALETEVCIGDIFACDGVRLRVTSPRRPCYKLGMHMGADVPRRMQVTGRCGWYFSVRNPGMLPTAGAILVLKHREEGAPTVAEVFASKVKANPEIPGPPDD